MLFATHGFVAVGAVSPDRLAEARRNSALRPAIWRSRDGAHWQRVDVTSAVGKVNHRGPRATWFTQNGSVYAKATVDGVTVTLESNDGNHWHPFAPPARSTHGERSAGHISLRLPVLDIDSHKVHAPCR